MLSLRLDADGDDVATKAKQLCEQVARSQDDAEVDVVGTKYDIVEAAVYVLASAAAVIGLRLGSGMFAAPEPDQPLTYRVSLF